MSPEPPLVRRCTSCCRRGKELRALFFRRRFLVSCSTSVCICCTSPQPIYWSKCPRCKAGENKRAWAKISRKMGKLPVLLPPQHESSRVGASLPPVCVRTGIPHRQTLLLHRWESSENVRGLFTAFWASRVGFWLWGVFQVWHVGGQLRVYTDGYTDPHVPGSGLWFGSCREPGTGHGGGQL